MVPPTSRLASPVLAPSPPPVILSNDDGLTLLRETEALGHNSVPPCRLRSLWSARRCASKPRTSRSRESALRTAYTTRITLSTKDTIYVCGFVLAQCLHAPPASTWWPTSKPRTPRSRESAPRTACAATLRATTTDYPFPRHYTHLRLKLGGAHDSAPRTRRHATAAYAAKKLSTAAHLQTRPICSAALLKSQDTIYVYGYDSRRCLQLRATSASYEPKRHTRTTFPARHRAVPARPQTRCTRPLKRAVPALQRGAPALRICTPPTLISALDRKLDVILLAYHAIALVSRRATRFRGRVER
ncbi:hypothetical protein C8R44DRAFT_875692 [Mycena epipterygia]|nr:hypothetical protein C8R44DRAFT_875692 [Mycena epipterygia]